MSKIQLPPKRQPENQTNEKPVLKLTEKKIQEIINKGGSTIKNIDSIEDKLKNFNILVLESDLEIIGKLCDKRPKKHGRIIGFSKKDWLLEAVQEKIDREIKKYHL